MKFTKFGLITFTIILGACEPDADSDDYRKLPNCGYEDGNDLSVSGSKRSGWKDEGNGFISNVSSSWYAPHVPEPGIDYASLNQSESQILYCPAGDGVQIETVGVPTESLLGYEEFLQVLREREMFKSDYEFVPTIIGLAKSFKLQAVPTKSTKESEVAACGCMTHYPELDLPWTTRDD